MAYAQTTMDPQEVRDDRVTALMTAYGVAAVQGIQTNHRSSPKNEDKPVDAEARELQGSAQP